MPEAHADRHRDPEFIRATFASIAGRYDLANHALSLGVDFVWRARAARMVAARRPRRILDLAAGSGDLSLVLSRRCPDALVVGADFCEPILQRARARGASPLVVGDGTALPFASAAFDAVTVAFGLRNMRSREEALAEMRRVLARGGMLLVMDFSMPVLPVLLPAYRWYLHRVLPKVAGLLTGRPEAYEYLGDSIEAFPRHAEMLALLRSCGFCDPKQQMLSLGIASIYTGTV